MNIKETSPKVQIALGFVERLVSLGTLFLAGVLLARALGPVEFGRFSYFLAIVSLAASFGHMGVDGALVKRLIAGKDNRKVILGGALYLKLFGYLISVVLLLFFCFFSEIGQKDIYIILCLSVSTLLRPMEVFEFWLLGTLKASLLYIIRIIGYVSGFVLKIGVIYSEAEIEVIALVWLLPQITTYFACFFYYYYSEKKVWRLKYDLKNTIGIFSDNWPIYVGSICAVIYLKIDLIMVRVFDGDNSAGIYAVAISLTEAWSFLGVVIMTVFFPSLIKKSSESLDVFRIEFRRAASVLLVVSYFIVLMVCFFGSGLIELLYGDQYYYSQSILMVYVFSLIFVFVRMLFSKWILIEGVAIYSLISHGLGMLINVLLNIVLINKYGAIGAAYSTLISYSISGYFVFLFMGKSRSIAADIVPCFFMPIKFIRKG